MDQGDTEALTALPPLAKVFGGLPHRAIRAGAEEESHASTPSKVLVTGPPTHCVRFGRASWGRTVSGSPARL
jgi:hypothetical protein